MLNLDALPTPSEKRLAIHVKPAAERALRQGHPWVFDESIRKQSHAGRPGDLAVIFDQKRRFLAIGLYDPDSPIRVRVLQHHQPAPINREWFTDALRAAAELRQPLIDQATTGYRLCHGENDRMPGLVIDRYGDTLALKLYTAAWLPHLRDVLAALDGVHPAEHGVLRLSRNIESAARPYGLHDGLILFGEGLSMPVSFEENGLNFAADVVHGHKTGFFFDQRDNRARVRSLSDGRRVLDVFAYSGGFSVYAAAGGARSVTSLDVSGPALAEAAANFQRNQDNVHVAQCEHTTLVADAFDGLAELGQAETRFDMVIVDPPAFAKRANEIDRARNAYSRLTQLALDVLEPGGLLVMASCSSRVTPDEFFNTVEQSALSAGRPLTDITRTGHAPDHPITYPEGEYLKCLFATVPE